MTEARSKAFSGRDLACAKPDQSSGSGMRPYLIRGSQTFYNEVLVTEARSKAFTGRDLACAKVGSNTNGRKCTL